jgi:hypothetical protein
MYGNYLLGFKYFSFGSCALFAIFFQSPSISVKECEGTSSRMVIAGQSVFSVIPFTPEGFFYIVS